MFSNSKLKCHTLNNDSNKNTHVNLNLLYTHTKTDTPGQMIIIYIHTLYRGRLLQKLNKKVQKKHLCSETKLHTGLRMQEGNQALQTMSWANIAKESYWSTLTNFL